MKFTTTTILATIVALALAAPTPYYDSLGKDSTGNSAIVPRATGPISPESVQYRGGSRGTSPPAERYASGRGCYASHLCRGGSPGRA
ncbi:hypothetical protein CFE70_002857 [Pyrenophora teres f. teres 0-1]|nr:hypothetical protein PTNB85_09928 [Pyrenophora teres f. teres]KAE8846628.1 hypothetical protein HRS9139_01195 [Pyrenophora teres f. teres]KAE8853061.1 hypothetical protein HRS9122_00053 [Pyrenophora teres f. teres]KAE8855519.1 hypothetical protein PTNB73_10176 [Pyrenophora teres f. teres]